MVVRRLSQSQVRLPVRMRTGKHAGQIRWVPPTLSRVLRVLIVTLLAFVGVFLPFTYMSAVFAPATGGDQARLALLLMAFGIAATAGNLIAGRLADRYAPRLVVIGATLGIALVFLIMLSVITIVARN